MRHRLHFSTGDYLRTIVLGFTILPFRLCGLLSCFTAAWAVASIGLIGADLSRPLVGWRAVARKLVAGLGRVSMLFCGFHWVQVNCFKPSPCAAGGGEAVLQGGGACACRGPSQVSLVGVVPSSSFAAPFLTPLSSFVPASPSLSTERRTVPSHGSDDAWSSFRPFS